MDRVNFNNDAAVDPWAEARAQIYSAPVEQPARAEPMPAARPDARTQPEILRAAITNLDSPSYRTREEGMRELRAAGPAALPYITQGLEQNPPLSLEQTRRLQLVLNYFGNEGLPRIIDGMRASDVNTRNAAMAFLSQAPTSRLLRQMTDLTPSADQLASLRQLMLNRNSAEELEQLYGYNRWTSSGVDEETHRRTLGYSMLFDQERVGHLSQQLGMTLFREGGRDTEAARLLERGAESNESHTQFLALRDLASIHARQGRPQEFVETMRGLRTAIRRLEGTGLDGWVDEGYTGALQQINGVLQQGQLRADQRGRLEMLQAGLQADLKAFRLRQGEHGRKKPPLQ